MLVTSRWIKLKNVAFHSNKRILKKCQRQMCSKLTFLIIAYFVSNSYIKNLLKMPRHNLFSNSDMRDMICVYAQENFNGRRALRRYTRMYPNRRHPNFKTFQNLYQRLGETGSFRPKRDLIGRPKTLTVNQEEEVLVRAAENPEISTRRMAAGTGVSKSSVLRVFHQEKLYPYHFTPVQNLRNNDLPNRLRFAQFCRNQQNDDPMFLNKVLFTDEATFTRRGIFNFRNKHAWDIENPNLVVDRHFQHEFKINIWCGIIDNNILGPYQLPPNLNGESYLHFLQTILIECLDDLPLNLRQDMLFMQDGAPPHFSLPVRNYLNTHFPDRWIGRGGPIPWPARSPDFNPLDFCVWGYLKSLVYEDQINTREDLMQRIENAVESFRNENMCFKIRRSFNKRVNKCIEVNGSHFEQLLSRMDLFLY